MSTSPTHFIYLPLKMPSLYICESTMGDERSSGNPVNGSLARTDHDGQFPPI